jgi:2C-methyl-D-erythritol 2,4-cyclodiphosphate synthase
MTMKLTKCRINKLFSSINQTRKKLKNRKMLTHSHTFRQKKPFNLKNITLRTY